MQVFWGEPQFYDNADKDNVNVHPSHINGDNFQRGKHLITYLARDKALNYVKCTFSIQVERKRFNFECLFASLIVVERKFRHTNIFNKTILNPPQIIKNFRGFHTRKFVLLWAFSCDRNTPNTCMHRTYFSEELYYCLVMQCPVYDPPKHGSSSCNIRKDGVIETHICTVSCKQDTWFMKGPNIPTLYHYYVCGEHGQWRGQNTFNPTSPTNFVPIPKGQTPWPDCASKYNIHRFNET